MGGSNDKSTVPRCVWPRSKATIAIIALMTLQGIVCLIPRQYYPSMVYYMLAPLQQGLLRIFHSYAALRWFFYVTFFFHSVEAIFVVLLIRNVHGHIGGFHSVLWVLQTVILGFPSVIQLRKELKRVTEKKTEKTTMS